LFLCSVFSTENVKMGFQKTSEAEGRPLALTGVRVLDFTRVLAGPFCTMLLGDMGADVIKVEAPRGDDTRHWGPPWLGEGKNRQSAYYLAVNRNKRSLVLNLKSPEGQAIARDLANQSHILVENFKPGQMAEFGLAYDTLKQNHPALVYASITGFGQTGRYRDIPGYDHVIQAMSGLMSITGSPNGEPYKVGVAVTDVLTGMFTLSGILAALRQAEHKGQGQYLDLALLDSQLAGLVNIASGALISGQTPPRYGNAHPNIVPYQTFTASDGDFVLNVGNDGQFAHLCAIIDRIEWLEDLRFATNPQRVAHRHLLIPMLESIFRTRTASDWVERLVAHGIPAGAITSVTTALNDPHVRERNLIRETTLSNGETLPYVASPLQPPGDVRYPPPALGEHTDEILRDVLGYTSEVIQALYAADVVGTSRR
jgi:crotonobetainyl-CoA:carnitine CoA-transferase CaiB-like acyl-CoA transferase